MIGTVLAEAAVGVKAPQSALPQVFFQVTPWFLESLVTVAATPHCSLTVMAVGGVKPGVKVTVMAGGMELWVPQAERSATAVIVMSVRAKGNFCNAQNLALTAGRFSWDGECVKRVSMRSAEFDID